MASVLTYSCTNACGQMQTRTFYVSKYFVHAAVERKILESLLKVMKDG